MKIFLFPFLLFSFGCLHKKGQINENTFILSKISVPKVNKNPNEPPPPPPILYPYYYDFNFIIDTAENIYYFQTDTKSWLCGTGINQDTPPDFISLKPKDLIRIPANSIESFIALNILNNDIKHKIAAVSVLRDTVRSVSLFKIIDILKENHVSWFIRKATQEESIVIDHKKRQASYDFTNIKWDSTKIQFPMKIDEVEKFTVPVVY